MQEFQRPPGPHFNLRALEWSRVSPKYAMIDLIGNLLTVLPVAIALIVTLGNNAPRWVSVLLGALIVFMIINSFFAFRRVKAIGYILREDDFLFRRGILWERIVAVPYGRLQIVDVTSGPLQRAFGLASLKFVTAAALTQVSLPGLPREEAERLRDVLVDYAESRRSGL